MIPSGVINTGIREVAGDEICGRIESFCFGSATVGEAVGTEVLASRRAVAAGAGLSVARTVTRPAPKIRHRAETVLILASSRRGMKEGIVLIINQRCARGVCCLQLTSFQSKPQPFRDRLGALRGELRSAGDGWVDLRFGKVESIAL